MLCGALARPLVLFKLKNFLSEQRVVVPSWQPVCSYLEHCYEGMILLANRLMSSAVLAMKSMQAGERERERESSENQLRTSS